MMAPGTRTKEIDLAADSVNLLLVEDCPEFAALVQRWLWQCDSDTKFSVKWIDSLKGALAHLEDEDADLVLLDLGLPDSEGLDTFVSVRTAARDLPTVVLTGGENEALALATIALGAQEYVVKSSCTADLLGRILRHAVVRHRLNQSRVRKLLRLAAAASVPSTQG